MKCPSCAEEINGEAMKCKFCGESTQVSRNYEVNVEDEKGNQETTVLTLSPLETDNAIHEYFNSRGKKVLNFRRVGEEEAKKIAQKRNEIKSNKQNRKIGYIVVGIIIFLMLLGAILPNPPKSGSKPEFFEYSCKMLLKSMLRDPDSLKIISESSEGNKWYVEFTAKNGFGGVNRQYAIGTADGSQCQHVKIIDK